MTTSNHRSLQDSTTRVPSSSGDRDFEITFDAPGLSSTTSTHARPYLSYRVAPLGASGTQLVIELNQTEIVNLSYNTTVNRTMTEIFDHGVLRATGNQLRVFVPNGEPGSVDISDLVLTYSVA